MKKILVIEDNADIRENTSEILSLANYTVITAENGKIGVALAISEKPDLIICDIMMPELDGYGVLHILSKKPETAAIPFIFVTAKTERSDIRKGMELGADDYLTKPFDDNELLNAIEIRFKKSDIRTKDYEHGVNGLDSFIVDAQKVLHLKDLCKDRKTRSVKKKNEIYSEGDTPQMVFFVKSGEIKASKAHAEGKELITSVYKKDDFFGFEPILDSSEYQDSAIAMQDSEIISIPKQDFLTMILRQPDVSSGFISLLCKKVADKEKQLINLAYSSVRQRTAEALLKISHLKEGGENEKLEISREDLAKMVGTASESVIRVLSELKEEGIIAIEGGRIQILQPAKLEKVVRWNVAR
ncbi:MAG TPA: response regulator [Cyclobacteriaceae bacterium]|nr:response regulator [Cyclobacteriaceae bacterium]